MPDASTAILSLGNIQNERIPQATDPMMKVIGDTGQAAGKIYLDRKHVGGFFL